MSILRVENLSELSDERRGEILSRSMTDVSDVYNEMRAVVEDIGRRGDMVSIEHYRKYKSDITAADITATEAEVRAAYEQVPDEVVTGLKLAAANIEKFHRAQLERDMWSIEISPGIIAGRMFTAVEAAEKNKTLVLKIPEGLEWVAKTAGLDQLLTIEMVD